MIMKLQPGSSVIKSGYPGVIIREYLPDMYEVRLVSGVVVVHVSELVPLADYGASCGDCGRDFLFDTQAKRQRWLIEHDQHIESISFFRVSTLKEEGPNE